MLAMLYFGMSLILDRSISLLPLALLFILFLGVSLLLQIQKRLASLIIMFVLFLVTLIPAVAFWSGFESIVLPLYLLIILILFCADSFLFKKS